MAKEELIMKLSMMEQQANEIGEKVQAIDGQISELESLKMSLENMENSKGKEMLAPLGRGIFIKTEVKEEKVFVNVGSGTIVKKTFDEAGKIIQTQIVEMEKIKVNFMNTLEGLNSNLSELIMEAQKGE